MKTARHDPQLGVAADWADRRGASVAVLALGVILAVGCTDSSQLPRSEQTVDGMTIDLGVIPAELVQGHATQPGEPDALHDGTPKDQGSHHIVVAVFDAKTGTRIVNARIRAGIGDRSHNPKPDTWLEPMEINGMMTYGNFFLMPGTGVWRIHLEIYRPGIARPSVAEFAYEHAPQT